MLLVGEGLTDDPQTLTVEVLIGQLPKVLIGQLPRAWAVIGRLYGAVISQHPKVGGVIGQPPEAVIVGPPSLQIEGDRPGRVEGAGLGVQCKGAGLPPPHCRMLWSSVGISGWVW